MQDELPKRCFASGFDVAGGRRTDYYTCVTCKLNWVCSDCRDCCHAGHELVPFQMDHKATWACCYCSRKARRNCQLVGA